MRLWLKGVTMTFTSSHFPELRVLAALHYCGGPLIIGTHNVRSDLRVVLGAQGLPEKSRIDAAAVAWTGRHLESGFFVPPDLSKL